MHWRRPESMDAIRCDIISIGTLSRNLLWQEREVVRTPHSTTTLLRSPEGRILVDPGLPPPALKARLFERTGLKPEDIDTVFLTNFRPAHRAGLALFERARVLIHAQEQQASIHYLRQLLDAAPREDIDRKMIEQELRLLDRLQPAEDRIAKHVDLFPLFGYTPGSSGLIVSLPMSTIVIAGDAVPTQDHFLAGQVLPDAHDIHAAQKCLEEVYEIADLIVPGHDNIFVNPRSAGI